MADLSDLALTITCTYCGAVPGQRCVTRAVETRGYSPNRRLAYPVTGLSSWSHAARTRPVWAIYWAGWTDCREDAEARAELEAKQMAAAARA